MLIRFKPCPPFPIDETLGDWSLITTDLNFNSQTTNHKGSNLLTVTSNTAKSKIIAGDDREADR